MNRYEVWQSGFMVQGDHKPTPAKFLGVFEANSWKEATYLAAKKEKMLEYYNYYPEDDRASIWGCTLYDNPYQARKTFG